MVKAVAAGFSSRLVVLIRKKQVNSRSRPLCGQANMPVAVYFSFAGDSSSDSPEVSSPIFYGQADVLQDQLFTSKECGFSCSPESIKASSSCRLTRICIR